MKRFHVHLNVKDLAANIAFYTRLFGAPPTRVEEDYAKWMLEDPRLNFAISTRGKTQGLDHLGIQVDSAEALAALKASARHADMTLLDEGQTACCYANSEKHWIIDPTGVPWEHFHTLTDIPTFNQAHNASTRDAPCCTPLQAPAPTGCCASQSASTCCP